MIAQRGVEVTVPGEWYGRAAHDPEAEWVLVSATPATVPVRDGEAYRLRVRYEAGEEQLKGLADLQGVPGLQALDLGGCSGVTDASLAHLRGLNGLRQLDIQWCQAVTDAGLEHLRKLSNLRELNLTWVTEMTDTGLAALHGLTGLKVLALDCCWNLTSEGLDAFRARVPDCAIEGP
jgi:hypothetical protein